MTIAVDFDGTIVTHEYPKIGEELPFATETLKMLIKEHHKLILWTVREGAASVALSFTPSTKTIPKKDKNGTITYPAS